MINTSNSGMMSSSSHILRHYDFTLLVMISKESMLEYIGHKVAASLTPKCTLVPNMREDDFQTAGGSRGPYQGEGTQDFKQKRNLYKKMVPSKSGYNFKM